MCQKVRIVQFSGIFPFILSKCLWKWPKMWKILLFKTAFFGFCIYLVNLLLKENRSRDFSKTWLPKLSKWVLLLKNQLFTYLRPFWSDIFHYIPPNYPRFNHLKKAYCSILQNIRKNPMRHQFLVLIIIGDVNIWFLNNRTHLDTFGSQVFEKYVDQFSFSNRFTK